MTKGCRALVRCWESNLVWAEEWTGVFERPEQRPVASSADKLADETRVPCVCVDTLRFPPSYPSVTVCWVLSKDFVRFTVHRSQPIWHSRRVDPTAAHSLLHPLTPSCQTETSKTPKLSKFENWPSVWQVRTNDWLSVTSQSLVSLLWFVMGLKRGYVGCGKWKACVHLHNEHMVTMLCGFSTPSLTERKCTFFYNLLNCVDLRTAEVCILFGPNFIPMG